MTRRERFLCALNGKTPDKVPVFDFLSSKKLFTHFTGKEPTDYVAYDIMKATIGLNMDATFIPFGGFAGYILDVPDGLKGKDLADNQYIDEWGVVYQHTGASWPADAPIRHPVAQREDLKNFHVPDAKATGRLDGIYEAIEMNKGYDCAIMGGINGPFTVALMAMGLENMSYSLVDDETLIEDIMHMSNEFLMEAAEEMVKSGVDAICIAEDLAHKKGPFFSPAQMEKTVFPELNRLISHIKSLGVPVVLHSCGNVTEIFGQIVESGVNAINPIQKSAGMDLAIIKKQYGEKVCLIGNVDSTNTLPYASLSEIERETRECIHIGAQGGRFVISSDSDMRDEMPLENMLSFFAFAHKYACDK